MKSYFRLLTLIAICLPVFAYGALSNKTNGEFVTVSGKVANVKPHSFDLKYNGKTVLVEMDDYDWDADGYKLVNGDQVIVSGRIDKDFLEKKKIEAGSVYVKNLKTYFYANSADEEDIFPYYSSTYIFWDSLPEGASVDLQGKVTKVSGREFTLDTGLRKIIIDTDSMIYNPMDNVGLTQVDVGDRVRVSGKVDYDLFEATEIKSNFIAELK